MILHGVSAFNVVTRWRVNIGEISSTHIFIYILILLGVLQIAISSIFLDELFKVV